MVTTFYPPENFGGDGIFIERLSRALVSRGHRVTVIASHDAYRVCGGKATAGPEPRDGGPTVIRLKSPFGPLSALATQQTGRPLLETRTLEEALSPGRFDVIHYHNISLVGGPGVLAIGGPAVKFYTLHEHWLLCPTHVFWKEKRKLCDVKTCFTCQIRSGRPPQLWRYGGLIKRSLENVDLLISPSRFTMEKHRSEGIDRPMRHIPNFIPDAPTRSEVPARPFFLYAGRLDPSKGPDAMISAARGLDAEIRIAGAGPMAEELERLSRGVPNVRLLGLLTPEGAGEQVASARALVMPSRCLEVSPLSAAEAMLRGVPVVARRRGGLQELVETSGGGLLFEEDSELPAILARLAKDAALAAELGRKGAETARRLWLEEAHLSAYLEEVEARLASKAAP